jgi:hypothetical protein
MRLPAVHRPAEDTKVDTVCAQVARYGKPIGAGADDGDVSGQLIHP